MKKKRLLSMLLAATFLFSLTACARTDGGEKPSDEQPSQGTNSQAPADPMEVSQGVTDDTIYIGTASLVSGAFAYIGQPAYDGLRACVERFNAQGGVLGRKVELVPYGTLGRAGQGVRPSEPVRPHRGAQPSLPQGEGDPRDQHFLWLGRLLFGE